MAGAKGERKPVQIPQPFADIIDRVCAEDRTYFEQHPGHSFYWRPYVPGEFWPGIIPEDAWVEVRQIVPGGRTRIPHFRGTASQKDIENYAKLCGEGTNVLIFSDEGEPVGMAIGKERI